MENSVKQATNMKMQIKVWSEKKYKVNLKGEIKIANQHS